jgi:hypothetical protein
MTALGTGTGGSPAGVELEASALTPADARQLHGATAQRLRLGRMDRDGDDLSFVYRGPMPKRSLAPIGTIGCSLSRWVCPFYELHATLNTALSFTFHGIARKTGSRKTTMQFLSDGFGLNDFFGVALARVLVYFALMVR